MSPLPLPLKKVDRIEILTLMDNYSDSLLKSTDVVKRPSMVKGDEVQMGALLAEHGLSLLITLFYEGGCRNLLMDAGGTEIGVPFNMDQLGVDPQKIEGIVVSHSHLDHTGGLYSVLDKIGAQVPVVVHPDVFLFPRYKQLSNGKMLRVPRHLVREKLMALKAKVIETTAPTLLMNDRVLVTGEIERTTPFEKGLPNAWLEIDGQLVKDSLKDDQSVVLVLEGRGLVVISGCSHAGIVNTVRYAKKLAGIEKVYAVLGGFHLSGPLFESIVDPTLEALEQEAPEVIVPMHCTGWQTIHRISEAFPEMFVLNSVGSKIMLS